MNNKAQIQSVRIEIKTDCDADTSHLGEYADTPEQYAICATGEHAGKFLSDLGEVDERPSRGHEFPFFNPCAENYKGESEENIRKYCQQDFKRMERLDEGYWRYVGIVAKAIVVSANGVCQTLRSGGLWGIESDSDAKYITEIADEELAALREELESFGFGSRAIDHAFKNVKRSE